jgi:hypothetical protein
MSSLSRTYARESKRGKKLMEQYQPEGAYQKGEDDYQKAKEDKRNAKR